MKMNQGMEVPPQREEERLYVSHQLISFIFTYLRYFRPPTTLASVAEEKLSRDRLQTAEAVLSLGLVVVRELQEHGIATVFLNSEGMAELCPSGEHVLDALPEEEAVGALLEKSYSDDQLMAYLKGRTSRAKING
jgi:hypothetical protein